MIKLYFVEGISRFDTLYFSTIEEQESYYDRVLVKEVEDSYYPPHYQNKISLSSDDVNFNSKVNYLSIEFNEKVYYYFIDNITYENEDICQLDITMDVIQTYMFNINFKNVDVSRRLINRWDDINDNIINRNYLRENLSEGIFQVDEYFDLTREYKSDYYNTGYFIAKCSKENLVGLSTPTTISINEYDKQKIYSDDTFCILIPSGDVFAKPSDPRFPGTINLLDTEYAFYENDWDTIKLTVNRKTLYQSIHSLAEDPKIVDITYFSENPLDTTYFETQNVYREGRLVCKFLGKTDNNIFEQKDGIEFKFLQDASGAVTSLPAFYVHNATLRDKTKEYTFNFEPSLSINNQWNVKFIPQLLDENYIQMNYGERINQASYPLSKSKTPNFIGHSVVDILTGYRNYWFTEPYYEEDKYLTLVTLNTEESATMWNDYWKQYQATHKGTLGLGTAYKVGKFAFNTTSILGSRGAYTPKRQQLSARAKRQLASEQENVLDELVEQSVNNINLQFSPETLSQGNAYSNDLLSKATNRIFFTQKVVDLEEVGKQYEGYGYKVHEHYAYQNIFNILNTRYYFNIIQCDYIDIFLNILNDNTTIERIKERFINGIRIWNNHEIGNPYTYDNVEKDFIYE